MLNAGRFANGQHAVIRISAAALAASFAITAGARAQPQLDWSVEATGQGGWLRSFFRLEPLSTVPVPDYDNESLIGRFYGRIDLAPHYRFGDNRVGVQAGVYSNLNSAYDYDRGEFPIDRVNLELTRIKPEEAVDFDRLLIFIEGGMGRLELGWAEGVNERTKVTAPLDWGIGSVGGDYPYFFDKPHDVGYASLAALGSANTSPRISYYSPEFLGMKVAVSFQPDTRNTGFDFHYGGMALGIEGRRVLAVDAPLDAALDMPTPDSSFEGFTAGFHTIMEAGVYGEHEIGDIKLRGGIGGIVGRAIDSPSGEKFNDLGSFQFGMIGEYRNFSIGAGYAWAGRSGYAELAHWRQRQHQYSAYVGAQYRLGDWTFGLAGLRGDDAGDPTERSDRQLYVYSMGTRYAISDNLDFGLELDQILTLSADFGDYRHYVAFAQLRLHFGQGDLVTPPRY